MGGGWLAGKLKSKGWVIVIGCVPTVIGTVLMLTIPRHNKGVLLFGYYLVSCLAVVTPMVYAWQAQNTAGDTKRKCTSGVVFVGMCTGNVSSTRLPPSNAMSRRKMLTIYPTSDHRTTAILPRSGTAIPSRFDLQPCLVCHRRHHLRVGLIHPAHASHEGHLILTHIQPYHGLPQVPEPLPRPSP